MTLRLSMIAQMADRYRDIIAAWQGHLLVEDHRTGREYVIAPADIVDLAESVVILSWRGDAPTGVILPLSDITIRQHDPAAEQDKPARRSRSASEGKDT